MKNKTLKQFVFSEMKKKDYVLDQEVHIFLDKEDVNYYTVEQYKKDYKRLEWAKEYFKDIKNPMLQKTYRKYLIRDNSWEAGQYKIIPKIYYDYLIKKLCNKQK